MAPLVDNTNLHCISHRLQVVMNYCKILAYIWLFLGIACHVVPCWHVGWLCRVHIFVSLVVWFGLYAAHGEGVRPGNGWQRACNHADESQI